MLVYQYKKKRRPQPPWRSKNAELHGSLFFHCLHHFDAHYVDGALVRINMCAKLDVMSFVSLKRFRIHNVPALLVSVIKERDLVAFSFDGALQRLQRRFGSSLAHVAAFSHLLRGGSHRECKTNCQCEDPELFHLRNLLRLSAPQN